MMAYCPICGTDHSPDILCPDKASDVLRHTGIKIGGKLSRKQFKNVFKKASKSLMIWLLMSPSGNGRKSLAFRRRLQYARRARNGVASIWLEGSERSDHGCWRHEVYSWAAAKAGFIRLSEIAADATAFRR
jgi:hypothetical protein